MKLLFVALLAVLVASSAASPARACAWWVNSTRDAPVPADALVVNEASSAGEGSLYVCACFGDPGHVGGLYNNTYTGWSCVYTNRNTNGMSYCGPSMYAVLVRKFKLSNDPKFVNSTKEDGGVPDGTISFPLGATVTPDTATYGACKVVDSSTSGDDKPIIGALSFDVTGKRSCLYSHIYSNFGGVSGTRYPGQYEVAAGSNCLLPP